ncbi:hypothetical protein TNCV_3532791 [Trichonephila clavipes]|nr:hypothetical protein TNCV_3532791 [Trichonephila clavipes]
MTLTCNTGLLNNFTKYLPPPPRISHTEILTGKLMPIQKVMVVHDIDNSNECHQIYVDSLRLIQELDCLDYEESSKNESFVHQHLGSI